eukprot:c7596_g1_i2.p1 GENE.c7596_g1_i2~~c7596_g1_i2.p1  ORF type:complete len:275 (+),score=89.84 c7596_g1_i2:44-868(+)
MAKSKREKIYNLTRTQKKTRALKQTLIDTIQKAFDEYATAYVFEYGNLRSQYLKEIRATWSTSRFFMGKNRVMQVALGEGPNGECHEGSHKLSKRLVGHRGLLFTNASKEDVAKFFNEYSVEDFARAGSVAPQDVMLAAGPLDAVPSMEVLYRKLGLPTELKNGVVILRDEHYLCRRGDPINVEEAKLLKLFGHKLANFSIKLVCSLSKQGFESYVDEREDATANTTPQPDGDKDDANDDNSDADNAAAEAEAAAAEAALLAAEAPKKKRSRKN